MRYVLSLAEQGMGSLITLGVNLWLIRNGQAASYGVYVFWFSIAWVLSTAQFTLCVVHLTSLPSGPDRLAERREPERVLTTVTLAILAVTALGIAGADAVLGARGSTFHEPAAILFIPAFLAYQFVRAFAFSRGKVTLAASLTGGVLLLSVLGLGADYLGGSAPDAARVLLIVGGAYGLSAIVILGLIEPTLRPMVHRASLLRYARNVRSSGWIALGAGSNEVTGRLYSFMVSDWFGSQALARLSAVQVVIRPAWIIASAWSSIGFPRMATLRADNDRRGIVTTVVTGAVGMSALSALWSVAVILAWPLVSTRVYRGQYADIGMLAYLWGGNVILGSVAIALNTAILAIGEYRKLALIDLAGAIACCASMALLLQRYDYPASIMATLLGQATQIALMAWFLSWRLSVDRPMAMGVNAFAAQQD
jgi:O-antigen/teichoic acid export membrane protein